MDNLEPFPRDFRDLPEGEVDVLWREVLRNERLWSEICVDLSQDEARTGELYDANRSWWFALHEVLHLYVQVQVQLHRTPGPLPGPLLMRLSKLTHDLGRGIVPDVVSDASKGSVGRPVGWTERTDIAHAIFYIQACKSGEIADRAYNKTVRETYNVTRRAVQKWVESADYLCVGIVRPSSPEAITRQMGVSGERYARIGRGAPSE